MLQVPVINTWRKWFTFKTDVSYLQIHHYERMMNIFLINHVKNVHHH